MQSAHTQFTVNMKSLYDTCLRVILDKAEKLRPDLILRTLDTFPDHNEKKRIVQGILSVMKEGKYDIRKFKFDNLV